MLSKESCNIVRKTKYPWRSKHISWILIKLLKILNFQQPFSQNIFLFTLLNPKLDLSFGTQPVCECTLNAFNPFPTLGRRGKKKNLTKQILSLYELCSTEENTRIHSRNGRPWNGTLPRNPSCIFQTPVELLSLAVVVVEGWS